MAYRDVSANVIFGFNRRNECTRKFDSYFGLYKNASNTFDTFNYPLWFEGSNLDDVIQQALNDILPNAATLDDITYTQSQAVTFDPTTPSIQITAVIVFNVGSLHIEEQFRVELESRRAAGIISKSDILNPNLSIINARYRDAIVTAITSCEVEQALGLQ